MPSLAGAAKLVHGPKFLVAMPIYASSKSGAVRGWLIATRAIDTPQWSRYEELAQAPEEPHASKVRVDPKQIRSFLAVSDLQVKQSATIDGSMAPMVEQRAVLASPSRSSSGRRAVPMLTLVLSGMSLALVATGIKRRRRRMIVWARRKAATHRIRSRCRIPV
jgi:hypothetical protein